MLEVSLEIQHVLHHGCIPETAGHVGRDCGGNLVD